MRDARAPLLIWRQLRLLAILALAQNHAMPRRLLAERGERVGDLLERLDFLLERAAVVDSRDGMAEKVLSLKIYEGKTIAELWDRLEITSLV